jgi:hypothetical protein
MTMPTKNAINKLLLLITFNLLTSKTESFENRRLPALFEFIEIVGWQANLQENTS